MSESVRIPYRDWKDVGDLSNMVEPGVGYEIPSRMASWAEDQGELHGAARTPLEDALADDNGVYAFVDGGIGVRRHLTAEAAALRSIPARRLVASEEPRKKLIAARVDSARDELPLLVGKEDAARGRVDEAKQVLEKATVEQDELSFSERGLIGSKWTLIAVETSCVAFDVAVLHAALEYSGMGSASVWLTSILAPAAIGMTHYVFGTVLGAAVRKLPSKARLKTAVAGLGGGLLALMATFLLLALFRESATDAMNSGMAEIASGSETGGVDLLFSPTWLAALQVATSAAAIGAAAIWTLGKPGRDLSEKVAEAKSEHVQAEKDLATDASKVEDARRVVLEGPADMEQVSVEAREAEAENEGDKSALALRLGAEDALGHAVKGKYKNKLIATNQIYKNGQVRRAAQGDEERRKGQLRRRPSRDVSEQALAGISDPNDSNANPGDSNAGDGFRRWFS